MVPGIPNINNAVFTSRISESFTIIRTPWELYENKYWISLYSYTTDTNAYVRWIEPWPGTIIVLYFVVSLECS